eukprot:TRINITY_DN3158_c0_g1_i1.p1 TRINITY_DN3158_c0_g1~~TRINITY_DN3158_c0_g1_i1.p1  ORF type:complete len:781 (-),score=175.37 TRINITY_DN3158_c0_g1_i1:896-3160(-)
MKESDASSGESLNNAPSVSVPVFHFPEKPVEEMEFSPFTDTLEALVSELKDGEIVLMENFTLFEAMSAVELMDPKMDSGMLNGEVLTTEEALSLKKIDPDHLLTPAQLISLMDALLEQEALWCSGQTLANTIFTCLYAHQATSLTSVYLSPFILSLLKYSEYLKEMIIRADIYEEEDFIANTFGFSLCEKVPETEIMSKLKEAEDDLVLREKKAKGKADETELKPLQDDPTKELSFIEALLARLRFRKAMLTIQSAFEKGASRVEAIKKAITLAQAQIPIIKESSKLGNTFPASVFQPQIARRLSSTPPRPVVAFGLEKSLNLLDEILKSLLVVCSVVNCTSLAELYDFVTSFSDASHNVIARSRLHLLLFIGKKVFGKFPLFDWIDQDMQQLLVPDSLLSLPQTLSFKENASKLLISLFRIFNFNRARQRRKLLRSFDDWQIIQHEAEALDEIITNQTKSIDQTSPPCHMFMLWTLNKVLKVMILFLQLGFHLDLYAPYELSMVYCYMDYLYGRMLQNLSYVQIQKKFAKAKSKNPKKPNKPKKLKDKKDSVKPEQLILEAHQFLCRGLLRYTTAVEKDNGQAPVSKEEKKDEKKDDQDKKDSKESDPEFFNKELLFYHRFSGFHKLAQPIPLLYPHFAHFLEQSNAMGAKERYDSASEAFKSCQGLVEKLVHHKTPPNAENLSYLKSLAKIAISNNVQIQILLRNKQMQKEREEKERQEKAKEEGQKEKEKKKQVKWDFSQQKCFPIIQVIA